MAGKRATLDEIIATFSSHLSKSYPTPADFRRNFDILLWGKRDRSDAAAYALSLERNIVYLDVLVEEALSLVERLLAPAEALGEKEIASALGEIETSARRSTGTRHKRAFVSLEEPSFRGLAEGRAAGGPSYVEKLEFDYRYLMTLRLFLFEFISVLAAVRAEYDVEAESAGDLARIRAQLGVIANFYMGNVSAGDGGDARPGGDSGGGARESRGKSPRGR